MKYYPQDHYLLGPCENEELGYQIYGKPYWYCGVLIFPHYETNKDKNVLIKKLFGCNYEDVSLDTIKEIHKKQRISYK